MKEKYKWIFRAKEQENGVLPFFKTWKIPEGTARILQRRGICTEEALRHFLKDTMADLADPFLMKGMPEAVQRIQRALEQNEKIVIYGDYDVDGITATSILYRFFHRLGADIGFYIPGREGEGYGLNAGAVEKLCGEGYQLLITVDCGISSAELIDTWADRMDFIVTDHHVPPETLPSRAVAVINPHQADCGYPYKELAGCGVAYTLCRALWKQMRQADYTEDVELAAVGTIADMVPLTGENRILVKTGLSRFRHTKVAGLKALLVASGILSEDREYREVSADQISFGLAPRLNASGRIAHARKGVALMITDSAEEAKTMAAELCAINVERQTIERAIYQDALQRLEELEGQQSMVLVIDGKDWHPGVIGIVASRVLEQFHRPTLVITIRDGIGKGSCRSIPGFNIYEALKAHSDLLLQFGGHTMAAGFSIEEDKIPLFRERLNTYAAERLTEESCIPQLEIEQMVPLSEVTLDFIRSLALLEPCGCENPKPLFASRGVFVESTRRMGAENRHFKCLLSEGNTSVEAVFWNPGEDNPCSSGEEVAIAYEPEIHEWYGEHVQLIGKDIRELQPGGELLLDRPFLVEIFLRLRELLSGGSRPVSEVQHTLCSLYPGHCPEVKLKAGLIVFEEIGILSRYSRNGQEYFIYHALKDKMDLQMSPTFCRYRKGEGDLYGRGKNNSCGREG